MKETEPLYFLRKPEDASASLQSALESFGLTLRCFDEIEALFRAGEESAARAPAALVIDLDSIDRVAAPLLEQIRAAYPASELVALSSKDSSQLALLCLRSGFSDFLLKPASPDELKWSLRKCLQKGRPYLSGGASPKTRLLQSLGDLAASTSPTVLRLRVLHQLGALFAGRGAAWLSAESEEKPLCSVPRRPPRLSARLKQWRHSTRSPLILKRRGREERSLFLRCRHRAFGSIYLWGIPRRLRHSTLIEATALLDHAELCLMNLLKLAETRRQTYVDDLTGLYNSRYLKLALQNAVSQCRLGQSFSVLFIDVDKFKSVNDQHGHPIGSELLVALARTIKNSVRGADSVFRYGGDEFIVILQNAAIDKAREVAERLRRHIERRTFVVHNQMLRTTVSIGIAVYPQHAANQETLLRLADTAMYSAKKASRNSVHLALGGEEAAKTEPIQPEI